MLILINNATTSVFTYDQQYKFVQYDYGNNVQAVIYHSLTDKLTPEETIDLQHEAQRC